MSLIDPLSLAPLAAAYPREVSRLRHSLASHRLLRREALAAAARALPASHVEQRVHDAADSGSFAIAEARADAASAIAAGGPADAWIMLRGLERLPAYRALLERLIAEIAPAIAPAGGTPREVKGVVFVSAPGTHTPFHFDAEFNILFQIAGDKVFATYPSAPPFLDLAAREAYHRSGDNMLGWEPRFATDGQPHLLAPGEALFVPHAAPHWVHAGQEPSISLSLTWQNRASRAEADALALNPLLRRLGLAAYDPAAARGVPWLRAAAGRVVRKAARR